MCVRVCEMLIEFLYNRTLPQFTVTFRMIILNYHSHSSQDRYNSTDYARLSYHTK